MSKKEYMKQYYIENKERLKENMKEYGKQYYIDNKEKIDERGKQYRKVNKEKDRKRATEYRKTHISKIKKYRKEYDKIHAVEEKARKTKYYKENPEYYRLYYRNRRKTDLKYNLRCKMTSAIYTYLRNEKAGKHWEILVGYTLSDLMKHLKKTIPRGYCWQDYLDAKLHIDHIIPISAFNFTKSEHTDFKRCWALENLRLLPVKENLIKSNKLIKPFQPALAM